MAKKNDAALGALSLSPKVSYSIIYIYFGNGFYTGRALDYDCLLLSLVVFMICALSDYLIVLYFTFLAMHTN